MAGRILASNYRRAGISIRSRSRLDRGPGYGASVGEGALRVGIAAWAFEPMKRFSADPVLERSALVGPEQRKDPPRENRIIRKDHAVHDIPDVHAFIVEEFPGVHK